VYSTAGNHGLTPFLPRTDSLCRPYVQALINGVSGNCHKSFPTYDEACRAFQDAKGKGLVEIISHRGDEERFRSDESAME
jgi:hypothetical protein